MRHHSVLMAGTEPLDYACRQIFSFPSYVIKHYFPMCTFCCLFSPALLVPIVPKGSRPSRTQGTRFNRKPLLFTGCVFTLSKHFAMSMCYTYGLEKRLAPEKETTKNHFDLVDYNDPVTERNTGWWFPDGAKQRPSCQVPAGPPDLDHASPGLAMAPSFLQH